MKRLNVYATKENFGRGIALYCARPGGTAVGDRPPGIAKEVEFVDANPEEELYAPMLRLAYDDAQNLMDELWRCGLRPSEGSGSAGALAAVERHLADLQKLVFAQKA